MLLTRLLRKMRRLVCLTLALLLLSVAVVEVPITKADTEVGGPTLAHYSKVWC